LQRSGQKDTNLINAPLPMPLAVEAAVVVVVVVVVVMVVVVVEATRVEGWRRQGRGGARRRRGGARGPADQFALRELHRGKSNSLSAPFHPEKCSPRYDISRGDSRVPFAKDDDEFVAAPNRDHRVTEVIVKRKKKKKRKKGLS